MTMKRGTLVETTKGKIGEVVESETWVIKDQNGITVSDNFSDRDVCETYKMEINPEYSISKLPCLVKLGKSVYPIFANNLNYLKTIYFNFKDFNDNDVILRQNQSTGLILKKFLEKANIKFYMFSQEKYMEDSGDDIMDDQEFNSYK